MRKIVATAQLRYKDTINTGYICISDFSIEGIFTLDYVKIDVKDKKMFLFLLEDKISFDQKIFNHTMNELFFHKIYKYSDFYIPSTHTLMDDEMKILKLEIYNVIHDKSKIDEIFSNLEDVKSRLL